MLFCMFLVFCYSLSQCDFNGFVGEHVDHLYFLNHRIQIFTAQGKYVRMFGQRGGCRGELDKPTGIDVDGIVYVSECDNHRVSLFTSKGQFLMSF